jgi:hypothetical protein
MCTSAMGTSRCGPTLAPLSTGKVEFHRACRSLGSACDDPRNAPDRHRRASTRHVTAVAMPRHGDVEVSMGTRPTGTRPAVAAFDFDGTLTYGGSVLRFLVRVRGAVPVALAVLRDLPRLAHAAIVGGTASDDAKEALFMRLLAGFPAASWTASVRSSPTRTFAGDCAPTLASASSGIVRKATTSSWSPPPLSAMYARRPRCSAPTPRSRRGSPSAGTSSPGATRGGTAGGRRSTPGSWHGSALRVSP